MGCRVAVICLAVLLAGIISPSAARAATKSFRLEAPDTLVESGLLRFLLPRFTLKHGIRIEIVKEGAPSDARLSANAEGTPVFEGPEQTWSLSLTDTDNAYADTFADWLTGEVGRNTVDAFEVNGRALFSAALEKPKADESVILPGNEVAGEKLAEIHCGRCHMVNEATRLTTVGSTPSFAVMRGFTDWQTRFEAFFVLNPHPSFTVIDGVTEPFDETRPSPMVPVTITIDELEAILAFVSRMEPADLGAPIQYQ